MKLRKRRSKSHSHAHTDEIVSVPLEESVIGLFVRVQVDASKHPLMDHSSCHHQISGEIDPVGDLRECLQSRYMQDIVDWLKPLDMKPLMMLTFENMTADEIAKVGKR
jgi:hypothetical protein